MGRGGELSLWARPMTAVRVCRLVCDGTLPLSRGWSAWGSSSRMRRRLPDEGLLRGTGCSCMTFGAEGRRAQWEQKPGPAACLRPERAAGVARRPHSRVPVGHQPCGAAGLEASPWVPRSLDSPDCPSAAAATPNFKVSKRGPCPACVPSTCLFLSPPASPSGPCFLGGQLSSSVGVADHCFRPPVPVPAGPPQPLPWGTRLSAVCFPGAVLGPPRARRGW